MAIWAAERLLTTAHAVLVGVLEAVEVEVAIQLQALEIRKEGLPTYGLVIQQSFTRSI